MESESFKRKLSAILSADVKGYSRLMEDDEEATVRAINSYRDAMTERIQNQGGRVVDATGDNLLAEFPSIVDAIRCAVEIQKEIKEKNRDLPDHRKMKFRIGINLGDVIDENGVLYGDGINIAARLEGLTDPGEISVSGTVYDQVAGKGDLEFESLGEHYVKNISKPIRVYRVITDTKVSKPESGINHSLPDKPSIAVLPFVNMSGDTEQEYFSDGITEDLITDLSKISGLLVIARNSVFTYKGKTPKVEDVRRELGVRYILEGSVRKSRNRVRITAQLIDTMTKGHIWAERYDRNLNDIFDLQDEVTQKIVTMLAVKLKEDEQKRLALKGTDNIKAYDFLLRGGEYFYRYTKETNIYARQMFEKSIDSDPDYALAYSFLSLTYLMEWILGWSQDPACMEHAFEIGGKAVSMDDSLAGAHQVLGMVYLWKKQHKEAIEELEKTLSLEPNNADGYAMLGNAFTWAGRFEEAIEAVQKAIRLNPYHPGMYLLRLGQAYGLMGQYDKAIEALKASLDQDPNLHPVYGFLAFVYMEMGRKNEAQNEIKELLRLNPHYSLEVIRKTFPLMDQTKLENIVKSLSQAGLK